MEGEEGGSNLQSLLHAIKASESNQILDARIPLVNQLEETGVSNGSELTSIAECLFTLWEESTCTGTSHCKLNKAILQVAAKYLKLENMPDCLCQFLILATKASIWCGKHLHENFSNVEDSLDERHRELFFQLVLDSLSFSSATFSALTRHPMSFENAFVLVVENFIAEQLNLLKVSISEIKRLQSIASEVLKAAQEILDTAVKLCKVYSQGINLEPCETTSKEDGDPMDCKTMDNRNHVINVTSCTIENFYKLGILAAAGGGGLVSILNVSWKGVVTLLQLEVGKAILANKINVEDIILTLVSLARESLKCTAEAWALPFKGSLSVTEAKRSFLPIKFYLINAVRICSRYPCEASKVFKDIMFCVLRISTLGLELRKETNLGTASDALAEFLEPTSFLLIHTLLNSLELENECKLQILDSLFPIDVAKQSMKSEGDICSIDNEKIAPDEALASNCEDIPSMRNLILGRVFVLVNLLKNSPDLGEEVVFMLSKKLDWLLDAFINENVYSFTLLTQIPQVSGLTTSPEIAVQPMFYYILNSLKTFMIVASSSLAWLEVEKFLLCNVVHPHPLCSEIVTELWCFLAQHAERDLLNDTVDKLSSLIWTLASSGQGPIPSSALRKMARSVCIVLNCTPQSAIDRIYGSFFGEDNARNGASVALHLALLMEGFPLDSLSENLRKLAVRRVLTAFCGFIESNSKNLVDRSSTSIPGLHGEPVYALSSLFSHNQIKGHEIDNKYIWPILRFTMTVIHGFKSITDTSKKDQYIQFLGQTLEIISHIKQAYACDQMHELVSELLSLFTAYTTISDGQLHLCKPALAAFLAGLSHMEISEGEECPSSRAIWELYHNMLREKHWALVHLGLAAFGNFAARTSCNQLWRFVPHDAALSFEIEQEREPNEENFMSELRKYLERDGALLAPSPCKDQLGLLVREGAVLREVIEKLVCEPKRNGFGNNGQFQKKRKLPEGINEGISLVQRGLKAMSDGLARWRQQNDCHSSESREMQEELSVHLSCLEDVVSHMASLDERG
ncbi:uncharacterized protein LOC18444030 isoform X1 [Amborella trichopoda]|uniref:uncharacterized protein LOC18444030 isoform X1 n=1 Tax=Amborella trichopoda TaxID=13333 RepID=UPI0009BD6696|nr:uncharacterized protein LOC18444030 isoform X1 [Amborella trichopoda]|eukprot:XP_020529266.1 uncharacterized protein LOC18444030 isoform X1 [Amborella trichopoda]